MKLDDQDLKILAVLQENATLSLEDIAARVGGSKSPVWARIRKLREVGVIKQQVAVLDAEKLGFDATFFVMVKTSEHEAGWQERFLRVLRKRPEVVEAHRLAGEIDYILKVVVENARAYDQFYQSLIKEVQLFSVTATLSMEVLKSTTALPIKLTSDS